MSPTRPVVRAVGVDGHSPASAGGRSGSVGTLRTANQRRVLDLLLQHGAEAPTQADLARESGLAAGTVSSIVRELADNGIVATVAGSGRRGTTVRLGPAAGMVAGIDFGHTHLAVAIADMSGEVVAERRRRLDPGQDHERALAAASDMLDAALAEARLDRHVLRTIGMGLPAPIAEGVVMSSAILPGWTGVNVEEASYATLGLPVVIENDANLGALAEHRRGAGRGAGDLVYVKVSSGVGAGLVINGQVFRGATGTAGEIGHLTLDEQGPLCRCGSRGCLEAYAATGTALSMMAGQLTATGIEDVIAAARHGNVAALRVFEDSGLHLGWGLAAVTNLLNPDVIVVGGDMARAGDLLLDSVRLGLRRHVLAGAASTPVRASELGDRASLLGAALLAIDSTDLLAVA
ncbi:MAG: ROK family transcriptional regulator [Marmoricola sp.]